MRKTVFSLSLLSFLGIAGKSQAPVEALNRWSAQSPLEKMYLHLDRDDYSAGATIWFKAYLYSDYSPDTISTTVYVDLLDNKARLVDRKILPVFFGNAFGQFDLPDSMNSGNYLLRAYSPTMLNHDREFIYKRNIFIYGKTVSETHPNEKDTRLTFFPEGGNFLSEKLNTVAFKANNENGLPVDIKGQVKNEQGETIITFSSVHDGLGMFELTPKPNAQYFAVLDNDPSGKKFYLPVVQEKGIVMKLMPDPLGLYYEILQKKDESSFQAAYMVGQMQHHIVFTKEFKKESDWITGLINTTRLNSGILQVTVFNKDGVPLAERLSFIDNKEYWQVAELTADTINFSAKAKNRLTLSLPDTVLGSFSVSITDPEFSLNSHREENIISRLLLTEDLKGTIHKPAYYFSSDHDSVKYALDLLMMTHGWRRFNWTNLLQNPLPSPVIRDPGYITLTGRVTIQGSKKPVPNTDLIVFISNADSSNNSMQMLSTNQEGKFRLDSLVFFDKTSLFFNDTKGKKSKWLDVHLDSDSISRQYPLPIPEIKWTTQSTLDPIALKIASDYNAFLSAKGKMLQGVTVKARKKSRIQELEEKYASGLFSGFSERTLDLTNSKETMGYNNIFDYLRVRVPGLQVLGNGFDYTLYYRQTASLRSMGSIPMTIYLNEFETDASMVATIRADMVAMVKVFSSFVGSFGNGAGGVLAIYTKEGADLTAAWPSRGSFVRYKGYSVMKEFYSPDYTNGTNLPQGEDRRITLDWQPNILVQAINPKIPIVFHNNERSRSFKVVIEGMTIDGRMLFIEKFFPGEKRPF